MSLTIELIDSVADFESLRADWNELVASMAFPEIFYSWDWNFLYFRHYRTRDELFIIVIRDTSKRIVGIGPFSIRRTRRLGCLVRVAETIAVNLADYSNILIRAGVHRGRVVSTILDFLHDKSARWDVVDVTEFNSRDATTLHLATLAREYRAWNVRVHISTPVAVRRLRTMPAEDTKRVRRVGQRLKVLQARGLRVRVGCDDNDEFWVMFRDLHRKAWPASPFREEKGRAFYDDLKASPGMKDKLELSVAEFDGRPVAMHFGFVDSRKLYYYMPVMDREFRKDRVGAALLYAMIQHYQKTVEVFDFMRGMEAYKLWYTDDLEVNLRIVIHKSSSFRAFLYNVAEVTRRFVIELGLPKAGIRLAQSYAGASRTGWRR